MERHTHKQVEKAEKKQSENRRTGKDTTMQQQVGEASKNSTLKRPDLVSVMGHNLKLARKPPAQTLTQLSKIARGERAMRSVI